MLLKPVCQNAFNLKERLKHLLAVRGWTAAELSRRSGVPKQVISLWMSGVEPRKISHLKGVATALGTTIDELCYPSTADAQMEMEIQTDQGSGWIEGVFEGRIRISHSRSVR